MKINNVTVFKMNDHSSFVNMIRKMVTLRGKNHHKCINIENQTAEKY